MTLKQLLDGVAVVGTWGDTGVQISGVTQDSRRAAPGCLFVAIRGECSDGLDYVGQAAERGAAGVVSDREPSGASKVAAWVMVRDTRRALPLLARSFHGRPDRDVALVGVTGTNGKTTTAHLIHAVLEAAGSRSGLIGGVTVLAGGEPQRPLLTTPEADEFYALLARMRDAGCDHCVMEVSSHALELGRVDGAVFRAAAFSNLTRDHLDFHGDMTRYFEAKKSLFHRLREADGVAVINTDDPHGAELAREIPGTAVTCGMCGTPDYRATGVTAGWDGVLLTLEGGRLERPLALRSPLVGRTNASNIILAAAVSLELGAAPGTVARAMDAMARVPGRFQPFSAGRGFRVVVDYAHTSDALRCLLTSLRELTRGRLITVFGCGGDRDRGKRPLMGRTAAEISDRVVVTSDNPRTEDPLAIIADVEAGCREAGLTGERLAVIPDRGEAVASAIREAGPGDTVVVAGKGHEDYQILGRRTIHFDDRELVERLIREADDGAA